MTGTSGDGGHEVEVYHAALDGRRLSEALRVLGPIEPALGRVSKSVVQVRSRACR
ncbi:hypothetical protein FHX34_104822 [Actinoplanes teichomyceticus]|uniref:Uncharacterized protein n=1 Tax=Actinoplanes teichomyceticus TaxID=1867 RepID=A0A561VSC3_ACTTI|nr:hypothetical protein FHX34_104822 [Actinoplanes teichomyceticus]GIF16867.1 hypothetical protein Ate01nite_68990 [Actinoplanes teichomyceticus]